jgi:iron complex outermembrane recepter protein
MKRILLLCLAFTSVIVLHGQAVVTGKVMESETGEAIPDAAVIIDALSGVATKSDGSFVINKVGEGRHTIHVKMLGYKIWSDEFYVHDSDSVKLDIRLLTDIIETDEVVVSATRTENSINDIPTRVNLITPRMLKAVPALGVDDYLVNIPGVNISRSFGIFSTKATITMRGLAGNEQARVLVMIDGIPVNKSDGGSVNWNLLDPDIVERIEVVKGPASSVYGSDAMGGAINIITRKPADGFSGSVEAGYGTYNTINGRLNLAHKVKLKSNQSFYWDLNGFYRKSDGYITQSKADQAANSYITPSTLKEYSGELKLGYDLSKNESVELDMVYYNDDRGTGEKEYQPEGNTTDHDTYQARIKYTRSSGKFDSNISLFWLNEDYKKVNEYIKDDYTFYKVLSKRLDVGILSSLSYRAGAFQKISAGIDLKQGSVDAKDVYYTSTDIVYNKGKMFNSGLFAQDEISLLDEKIRVIAGLRYDLAAFYKGAFTIEAPSAETSFMYNLQNSSFDNVVWHSLTPKISVNYSISNSSRVYVSFGRGFRPSVLDDLCRSGRIKGGFKLANPDIDPEYITNYEAGGDVLIERRLRVSASVYYSLGTDFMYYVNSGDSIDMGYGDRPIYIRTNIPKVHIYGAEFEVNFRPSDKLTFNAAYSYNHSEIVSYKPLDSSDPVDLTGKHLTDVPGRTFSLSGRWQNRFADLSMACRYQDAMWVNDQNVYDEIVMSDVYPAYTVVDMKISKEIKMITMDLGIQNILDKKFYDSKGAVCPGRFTSFDVKVRF